MLKTTNRVLVGAVVSFSMISIAHAKTMEQYTAHIVVGSTTSEVGPWSCEFDSEATYKEVRKNEKGAVTVIEKTAPMFSKKNELNHHFERPRSTSEKPLTYQVKESCVRSETYMAPVLVTSTDSKGNMSSHMEMQMKTDYYHGYMDWKCPVADPAAGSIPLKGCASVGSPSISGSYYAEELMKHFASEKPALKFNYDGQHETYAYDNCKAGLSQRKVLHLSQGVRGHIFEDDFRFKVLINGKPLTKNGKPWTLNSKDGLIDEDISYCPAPGENSDKLVVKVEAIEDGWFWDAHYRNQNQANLGEGNGRCSDQIVLKRANPFGEWWLSSVNKVSVAIDKDANQSVTGEKCSGGILVNASSAKAGARTVASNPVQDSGWHDSDWSDASVAK